MTLFCWVGIAAVSALLFGWIGYPLVLGVLTRARRRPEPGVLRSAPGGVTVIIATRETPETIRQRILDLRTGDFKPEDLEIVIAVDHTSAYPVAEYEQACASLARFVAGDPPGGKACTLNAAVRHSATPLLVFADSFQSFARDSISSLVASLADRSIGATTGTLLLGSKQTPVSPLLRFFWRYELLLRRLEARVDSVVAVTGAIYILRQELWRPLPAGAICDDLFVPFEVVRQGFRVSAAPEAVARDPRAFTRSQEFSRKVRTLTGMLQFCTVCPWVLSPVRNRIWFQFVCHKLLRLATPYLLGATLVAAIGCFANLRQRSVPLLVAASVLVLVLVLARKAPALRPVSDQLLWAGSLLAAPIIATANAVRGRWNVW